MKVGYARVSKNEQNEALQIDALKKAGCTKIFIDHGISGAKAERKEFDKALAFLRPGEDTFVVWKLDRAGRSLKNLIDLLNRFQDQNINFISITEAFDTSTPGGKLIFHVMGALAEFERDLIRERTKAGLEAARARGHKGGRRRTTSEATAARARELHSEGRLKIKEICAMLKISQTTLYRYINPKKEEAS